jgi:hypothetical protein
MQRTIEFKGEEKAWLKKQSAVIIKPTHSL